MGEISNADLEWLANVKSSPGRGAGESIDPTKPGPNADRIVELGTAIPVLEGATALPALAQSDAQPSPPQDVRGKIAPLALRALERRRFAAEDGRYLLTQSQAFDAFVEVLGAFPALAQSDAQPIERARYHLQAADHALHDVEGDPFADYAHNLVHEAAFFITDEPELQAMRKLPAQSDAQPVGWQLVPKEPTKEMLRAGSNWSHPGNVWEKMLAAAPTAPPNPDASGLIEAAELAESRAESMEQRSRGGLGSMFASQSAEDLRQFAGLLRARAADRSEEN